MCLELLAIFSSDCFREMNLFKTLLIIYSYDNILYFCLKEVLIFYETQMNEKYKKDEKLIKDIISHNVKTTDYNKKNENCNILS